MTRRKHDDFLAQYTRGVTSELGPPPRHPAAPGPAVAPPEPVALGGLIVLEDRAMRGWVTISGAVIVDITTRKPAHARPLVTDGVVLPGLLDMHNHPDFNVFAPWEPPGLPEPLPVARQPALRRAHQGAQPAHGRRPDRQRRTSAVRRDPRDGRRRTAIQGMNGTGDTSEPLVRNVDRFIFGSHRARTIIDLPAKVDGFGWETFAAVLKAIDEARVDAFYVHLAEGQRDDDVSRAEFDKLKGFGGLLPQTIVIHGSALTPAQLGERPTSEASSSGPLRATCASTARPPTSRPPSTPGSRCASAPTGCPQAP